MNNETQVEKVLNEWVKGTWSIDKKGFVNVKGSVKTTDFGQYQDQIKFGVVTGIFDCSDEGLTSLKGCPKYVGGSFNCYNNELTTLEGCPKKVDGDFDCSDNYLTSLVGCPVKINGNFYCYHNQLTSLKGCPKLVYENFNCSDNKLTSLKYCPKKVFGDFNCSDNSLTTLEGSPKTVGGDFYCSYNNFKKDALEIWLEKEKLEIKDGSVILYKRVSYAFKTQEGTKNETLWSIGSTLEHPTWKPDGKECGEGKYHACSRAKFCDGFRNKSGDRYIKIEVRIEDMYAWENPSYPSKIAFRKGIVLGECNQDGILI